MISTAPRADDALNLRLDDHTVAKITARAKAMGVAPEYLASMVLDARFFDYDDFTWINGDPRQESVNEPGLQENGRAWEDVRPEFLALIDRTFSSPE